MESPHLSDGLDLLRLLALSMNASARTNSLFGLNNFVSGSNFHDVPPSQNAVLDYGTYDTFQPCREIDAIIDDKVYLGE